MTLFCQSKGALAKASCMDKTAVSSARERIMVVKVGSAINDGDGDRVEVVRGSAMVDGGFALLFVCNFLMRNLDLGVVRIWRSALSGWYRNRANFFMLALAAEYMYFDRWSTWLAQPVCLPHGTKIYHPGSGVNFPRVLFCSLF